MTVQKCKKCKKKVKWLSGIGGICKECILKKDLKHKTETR